MHKLEVIELLIFYLFFGKMENKDDCKGNQNEFNKLHMFPLFFMGAIFLMWNFSLLPNSIQSRAYTKKCFRNNFYWPQPKVTSTSKINLKLQIDESPSNFNERSRKLVGKCSVHLSNPEFHYYVNALSPRLEKRYDHGWPTVIR